MATAARHQPRAPHTHMMHHGSTHAALPFDPALLAHKLEAHLQALEHQRQDLKPQQTSHHAYVPRDAARQFAATTSNLDIDAAASSVSTARVRSAKHDSARSSAFIPKQMQAGLSLGMSESEVLAAALFAPTRRTESDTAATMPHEVWVRRREIREQAVSDASSTSGSSCSGRSEHVRSGDKPRRSQAKQPSPPQAFYRPGDAAKRKMENRQSYAKPPLDGAVLSVTSGPDNQLLVDGSAYHRHPATNDMPYDMAMSLRPKLAGHDRHNWAQASQCGESFSKYGHPRALSNPSATDPLASSGKPLSATAYAPCDGNLVSDAVRLIKDEEKTRRKKNIVGFFKRL